MTYELSLSPNYVSNWGLKEAVREILQNAIDAQKEGHEMNVIYDDTNMDLIISNTGSSLDAAQLILGNSSKTDNTDSIGKYGEGFKLALLVLLRTGHNVEILNRNVRWTPEFITSKTYNTKVLAINEYDDIEDQGKLIFIIGNITEDNYNNLLKEFPCINNDWGETVECDTGYILKDPRFSGKMFVEGLYIQSDNNFRYGYNFNADVVNLDRDRKAINYWELRRLTAKSLITGETCDAELVNAIGNSCTDIKDLEDVLDDASDVFLDQYRTIFYATKGLKADTLVATKSVMAQIKQLDATINVVEGTEIQSYLIAKANDKLDLLEAAQDNVANKTELEEAYDNLRDSAYATLMKWIYTAKTVHNFTGWTGCTVQDLESIANEIEPYHYSKIDNYIDSDFDWSEEAFDKLKEDILTGEE